MLRARGESGELYPELSTVAAAGGSGRVARRGERKREGNGRWRRCSAMRGAVLQAGGGRDRPRAAGGVALTAGGVKQRSRLEEGESGSICNFRNSRDLTINHQ